MRSPLAQFTVLSALVASSVGCATAPRGPGAIDGRLLASAQAADAREVELHFDEDGVAAKISVEHEGAAAAPEAVRKLAESKWPGATLTDYELELYRDVGLVHEVEIKTADGKECEVSMTDGGALRYTECEVAPASLPAPVTAAIAAAAPGPEVTEAELRQVADGSEHYRVEVKSGGRVFYLRIKADGTLLGKAVRLKAEVTVPVR